MLVISAAKQFGLSLDELNEMRAQDLVDLLHEATRDRKKTKPIARDATQEDINKFFA